MIVTSDDPSAHSSTNEFDSRWQAESASVALLEPTTMQETKDIVPYAFELSERTGQMVIVRLTTRVCHGRGIVRLGELPERPHPIQKVREWDRLVCVSYLHTPMLERLEALRSEFENCAYNHYAGPKNAEKLIVAGGTGRLYAPEAMHRLGVEEQAGLLTLGTLWPLPEDYILGYLRAAKEVLILEEVDPFLERAVQALAGREGLAKRPRELRGRRLGGGGRRSGGSGTQCRRWRWGGLPVGLAVGLGAVQIYGIHRKRCLGFMMQIYITGRCLSIAGGGSGFNLPGLWVKYPYFHFTRAACWMGAGAMSWGCCSPLLRVTTSL